MERNENIEIKRILDILRSKKIWILLILISFIIFGCFYSHYCVIPKYKSTSTLLLIPNSSTSEEKTVTSSDLTLNSGLISTYSNIAKKSKVLKQVIENLGLEMTEEELLNNMEVKVIDDTYIIEISVTNTNPGKAMEITKELANVFLSEIKEIYNLNNIGIVDEAEISQTPYNVNHAKDILLFLTIGIILSCLLVMAINIFDNTISKEEEIEEYVKIKTLGNIPINADKGQELISRETAKSYITECINTIRTNILYMNATKGAKTVLITSCTPKEGKSWVSANIALSFAETNKKVLLIDTDMRKGRANKIFGIPKQEGLSNYLYYMTGEPKKDIELAKKYIKETKIPNLHILPNGDIPPNPSELISSNNMKELIAILKNTYDIVILDAPPSMLVTDSVVLSTIVDSTVLIVNSEETRIKDLKEVKKSIEAVGGNIIGAILNRVKVKGKAYSKNYYYGHTDEKQEKEINQREIISVEEVIETAKKKLKEMKYQIFTENVEDLKIAENENQLDSKKELGNINKLVKKQNTYLEKIMNMVFEVKTQSSNNIYAKELKNLNNQIEIAQLTLQKELSKIDYLEQINQINEMISNLKDSYLELSNIVKANEEKERQNSRNNIIDMKLLKRQRQIANRKLSYSIHEEIPFYELEKTATCVITIPNNQSENYEYDEDDFDLEEYKNESVIW